MPRIETVGHLVRRGAESSPGQFDIIEFAGGRKTGEVSHSIIENPALSAETDFHVGIDGDRRRNFRVHHPGNRRGNEKAFEWLETPRPLHPDIVRIKPAFQLGEQAEFASSAINSTILKSERHPAFRRKGYGGVARYCPFPCTVKTGNH